MASKRQCVPNMIIETKHIRPTQRDEIKAITDSFWMVNCDHFNPEFDALSRAGSIGKIHIGVEAHGTEPRQGFHDHSFPKMWAHAAAVWVTNDFVEYAKSSVHCPVLLHEFEEKFESPFPCGNEIANSNVGAGLNLFIVFWHWRREQMSEPHFNNIEEALRRRLLSELRGWNVKECLMEVFSRYVPWATAFGLEPIREELILNNRKVQLMGKSRSTLSKEDRPKAIWDLLMQRSIPLLRLTEKEKRVILLLMRGSSRKVIGAHMSSIKDPTQREIEISKVVKSVR
ncbi:MAG: hypothetical protein H7Y17_04495, partial [Chlorobia bacterium]|nr:hypothetical protein [Fimbriimonadaceae bacterium]